MFSQFFIDRPKFAFVISIVMVLTGILSVASLPVAEYPEIAPPQIMVFATYPGATAQDIVDSVAAPIESEVNGLENLLYYTSESDNSGAYTLNVFFKYGTNADIAQVNVQNAVKRAESILPSEVKAYGVNIIKRSSDILSMFAFVADPEDMSLLDLGNYVKMNVKDPVARVDGVNDAVVFANQEYSMRAWLDTQKMSAMGISTAEVTSAIQGQNIQAAAGSVGLESSNEYVQFKITVKGRLKTPEEFEEIIVRADGQGNTVKLKDIARVELGSEEYKGFSKFDQEQAVVMAIFRNSSANALDTVKAVKAELDRLSKTFPPGMRYEVGFDPTEFIEISMKEIVETLVIAIILVVVVTYLFLQDWRATIIPIVAIPVSLLGTFPFLWMFGFSINTLSMFGLILVIGSLVDDAIIVVENVMSHIEKGEDPHTATVNGVSQITGPVIAMTMVTVAIYLPICFYGGMVGQIYLQFAATMSISIVLSAVNALTLSPALCGMILRKHKPARFSFFKPFNMALDASKNGLAAISRLLVRRLALTIIIFAGVVYGNVRLFNEIPTSFLPEEDKGAMFCHVELPPGSSLDRTVKVISTLSERIQVLDGVSKVMSINGYSIIGGEGENMGACIVDLDHWDLRKTPELQLKHIFGVVSQIAAEIPEARIQCIIPPPIMGLGNSGGAEFSFCARGDVTPQELDMQKNRFMMELNSGKYPTQYAYSTYNATSPQLELDIDRSKAETLNVPINYIFTTLQGKLASYYVNDFNISGYNFKVKIQAEADERSLIEDISNLYIPNTNGEMVPFSALGEIKYIVGPQKIFRFNQMLSANFMAGALPGTSSGEFMNIIENIETPSNYQVQWTGMNLQEKGNEGQIIFLLTLSMTFAYLFLVAQYESWMTPIPVMLSVLVATLGALIGIKYCGLNLSIYAQLGLLMLIGLASKNAILVVEFASVQREEGMKIREAAVNAFRLRYRAVLMTAWSFILGVLPLAIATGAGAGSRQAIGITTCWGMLLATCCGIILIPGLFTITELIRELFQPKLRKKYKAKEQQRRLAIAHDTAISEEFFATDVIPAQNDSSVIIRTDVLRPDPPLKDEK
ncbi:MAG: efflux RND transporter permease subunit [Planctomycetia bacterium]|nr:efflux RND transporter permease subunit [Planctomycetia bacterium]